MKTAVCAPKHGTVKIFCLLVVEGVAVVCGGILAVYLGVGGWLPLIFGWLPLMGFFIGSSK